MQRLYSVKYSDSHWEVQTKVIKASSRNEAILKAIAQDNHCFNDAQWKALVRASRQPKGFMTSLKSYCYKIHHAHLV